MTNGHGLAAVVLLSFTALAARAQEHPPSAHPHVDSLGSVHFATTCAPAVAPRFDRAVALLHSFEFGQSIQAFREVLASDSTCAMAYWGIALSQWTNPMAPGNRAITQLQAGKRSADAAARLGAVGGTSERERGYIRAVSALYDDFEHRDQRTRVVGYERAMADLVARQPVDTEAKIFYAMSLVASASPTDKTYANQLKAGAILEPLWAAQPDHPGLAHYIIHAYDYPALAEHAKAAATRYAAIAPSAAHAQHMPSHVFTRVGMWRESIEANTRSMKVALDEGSIAEALHASDYAMYANLQLGDYAEAKVILDGLPALVARFDPSAVTGAAPGSAGVFAIAAIPARWALERDAWAEAAALEPKASAFPYAEAMTYFARALGASRIGDTARARAAVDSLASIQQRLSAAGEGYWAEQVAIQQLAGQAWLDLAEHHENPALMRMREAATREDATEKSAVTPGPLAPAREQLGDMLMELGRTTEAAAEYRAVLAKEPGRRRAMRRLDTGRAGDPAGHGQATPNARSVSQWNRGCH